MTSITDDPALATSVLAPLQSQALSYVRELRLKPEHTKPLLIGASVASALAILVMTLRARRRRQPRDNGNGVLGTILKSALLAALQTAVKVKTAQLVAKVAGDHTERERAEVAGP